MIIKSFEINKININNNIVLLYGLNQGHKEQIINEYFVKNYKGEIVRLDETEVINNKENFISSLLTKSLFEENKLLILSRITDKILEIINEIIERKIEGIKIILNSNNLDKKSKLRNLFEKNKNMACIPVYEDTEKSLTFITQNFFKTKNIKSSSEVVSLLVERSKGDRNNLLNELSKLESLSYTKNNINIDDVKILTNLAENYSVFELSENYLAKNKKKVSKILNENNYSSDECILILRTILNRSKRLLSLKKQVDNSNNIDSVISTFRPPIFWKEKEIVRKQIKSWSTTEVKNMIYKINNLEVLIKKNSYNSVNLISDFVANY